MANDRTTKSCRKARNDNEGKKFGGGGVFSLFFHGSFSGRTIGVRLGIELLTRGSLANSLWTTGSQTVVPTNGRVLDCWSSIQRRDATFASLGSNLRAFIL